MGPADEAEQTRVENRLRLLAGDHPGWQIRLLDTPRLVADASWKFVVVDTMKHRRWFGLLACELAPESVTISTEKAQQARDALPASLRSVPLLPVHVGSIDGLSFAISPFLRTFSANRYLRRLQFLRHRNAIIRWLLLAAQSTQHSALLDETEEHCRAAVESTALEQDLRVAASTAIDALHSSGWVPTASIIHGDYWPGNILIQSTCPGSDFGFHAVDWGGSSLSAYSVFDLLRALQGFKFGDASAARWISTYASLMGYSGAVLRHTFIASLGRLLRSDDHFPIDRLSHTASRAWARLLHWSPGD